MQPVGWDMFQHCERNEVVEVASDPCRRKIVGEVPDGETIARVCHGAVTPEVVAVDGFERPAEFALVASDVEHLRTPVDTVDSAADPCTLEEQIETLHGDESIA